MRSKLLLLCAFLGFLLLFYCAIDSQTMQRLPSSDQSLARMLWGNSRLDVWEQRFTAADSASYAFGFTTNAFIFTSDVYCSLRVYGPTGAEIDTSWQRIKPGESMTLGVRVRWFHVETSGPGLVRAKGIAD